MKADAGSPSRTVAVAVAAVLALALGGCDRKPTDPPRPAAAAAAGPAAALVGTSPPARTDAGSGLAR